MYTFENVKELARKYDIQNKIDPHEDCSEYYESWRKKLEEVEELFGSLPVEYDFSGVDIKNFNPRHYYDVMKIRNEIRENIHPSFDLQPYKDQVQECKIIYQELQKALCSKKLQKSFEGCQKVSKTVYIVDVDYENMDDGANIIMYCRDIVSDETYTLLYQFDDYFYVKIDDKTSIGDVEKGMKGFEWYLRENRYKESNGFGDPRHTSNINTLPQGKGGIKYFKSNEVIDDHKSIYGYRPHNERFLKVITSYPRVTRDFFSSKSKKTDWEFFEVDIDYVCKFLTTFGISACCSIDFEGKSIENHISTSDYLIKCESITRNNDAPPYVPIMYYWDIECLSLQQDVFPTSDSCPVIQISYLVAKGQNELKRSVLCLKETPGSDIYESFETEEQLLIRFAQTILEWNPDAIAGFNSNNFDMPYIIDRMRVLDIYDFASKFTRRKDFKMDYKRIFKQSKQFGTKEVTKYISPGFVMFDFFETIKADVTKKLRSYSLKSICAEYLKDDNKEELRYKDIPELFNHPDGRAKIASYCMKDTALLKDLDQVLSLGTNCWGMCKVLGTTPNVVLNRGLVFKLICKLKEYNIRFKLLIPTFTKESKPTFEGTFEGAFVLDPELGFHEDPIVTLDFASLYPSLMIGYNLSYDTLVLDKKWIQECPDNFEQHCGEWFVKRGVYEGVIPSLEKELAIERKKAKKNRDKHSVGSDEYNVYESLQLADKTIMNSLYGMLGSSTATVPMVQVAKTITGLGRQNLLMAKDYVEKHYKNIISKECPQDFSESMENCKVIYGDTDSIFIKMPGVSIPNAIKYGQILDKYTQKHVFDDRPPMRLEYEKVFCPFVITRRKGYVGSKYEFDPNKFKVNVMGLQLVRRDSAQLCIDVLQGFVDHVFKHKDKKAAVAHVKKYISDLYEEKLPMESYVITKKIAKAQYDTTPPHVMAWRRMIDRVGKDDAPAVGERFEFVVTKRNKREGMKDCIIDYELAKSKSHVEFDKTYYFETFIKNPIEKLLEYIIGEQEALKILDTKNYARTDTVLANKKNLLGFFGVEKVVKKTKYK